tara:strand:+ start:209 stop:343 length:135 start_codon:yes stop_codon:yes gene_type:complete
VAKLLHDYWVDVISTKYNIYNTIKMRRFCSQSIHNDKNGQFKPF